ncbi:MAG TPA: polyhydroxyalkanoate depolymerase [Caulobacterales bacterium]|nr:polyhydroxyalkanoate depolymerase [Caulobacterales bacterium]
MLYSLYEWNHVALSPLRSFAQAQSALLRSPFNPISHTEFGRNAAAAADVFESVTRRYSKPAWHIDSTRVAGVDIPVTVERVWSTPWCSLLKFQRDEDLLESALGRRSDPPVLIVAPMSGHYATLLHGTVETFLPDHDVYITDWADARMVPLLFGRFDLHDFIDHVREMIRQIGPGANVVGVCQPGPGVLAATSLMEAEDDAALPASMIFMGSPIDARRSPTAPNVLATEKPESWFRKQMIHTVPPPYPGALRRVYPGFVQLASFMGMNLSRHIDAHRQYFDNLVKSDGDNVQKHRDFYAEYLSVMDLTEEFYMQTIVDVFQEFKLPRGEFFHRGERVRPDLVRRVALMTVEGENDDISGVGQTQAAHDICSSIPAAMRLDYVQPDVGHYGVFNGRRFATEIYPRIREFIRTMRAQQRPRLRVVDAA